MSVFNDFAVFHRDGEQYVEQWHAELGFAHQFAILERTLYSGSRNRLLRGLSLEEPHRIRDYDVGMQGSADLLGLESFGGYLFVASEEGLFRFSPSDGASIRLNSRSLRDLEIAPCPATFPGDADCDEALTPADLTAQVESTYDIAAQHRCDADCNRDGRVGAADLLCVARLVAPADLTATSAGS